MEFGSDEKLGDFWIARNHWALNWENRFGLNWPILLFPYVI